VCCDSPAVVEVEVAAGLFGGLCRDHADRRERSVAQRDAVAARSTAFGGCDDTPTGSMTETPS
jgi:hypothetical protein